MKAEKIKLKIVMCNLKKYLYLGWLVFLLIFLSSPQLTQSNEKKVLMQALSPEPGWPIYTTNRPRQPILVDDLVPSNPGLEMVVIEDNDSGFPYQSYVEILSYETRAILAGWPQAISYVVGYYPKASQGDIDASFPGNEIIVVHEEEVDGNNEINVHLFYNDGTMVAGDWPKNFGPSSSDFFQYPVVAEIDKDYPGLEIVAVIQGKIYVWHSDGSLVSNWPYNWESVETQIVTSPAVGDIDNDGANEIVGVSEDGSVFVFNPDKSLVPGWPQDSASDVSFSRSDPILADINLDRKIEVITASFILADQRTDLYVFGPNGELIPNLSPLQFLNHTVPTLTVGNIDTSTSNLEIVLTFNRTPTYAPGIWVINTQGQILEGFPQQIDDNTYVSGPTIADMDGDGKRDIFFTGYQYAAPFYSNLRLYGYQDNGNVFADDFPVYLSLLGQIGRSPILKDIDNDNLGEITIQTYWQLGAGFEGAGAILIENSGAEYTPCLADWPMFRFDSHLTAFYQKPSSCSSFMLPQTGANVIIEQ